jgi:hypothetical protein
MPENNNISIAPVTAKSCKPFLLEVMVFSPEAGFKFEVSIEKSCIKATAEDPAKAKFKLVFDLFKQQEGKGEFDHIIHVSYTAENELQEKKLNATVTNGINAAQSKQLITKVHPSVKEVTDLDALPEEEAQKKKQKVKREMSKTVDLAF